MIEGNRDMDNDPTPGQGSADGAETIEGTRPRYTSPGEHGRRPPAGPRPRREEDVPEVVDGEVIDAEIVEDDTTATATATGTGPDAGAGNGAGTVEVVPARRPGTAVARVARQAPARLVATTRTVVTHPHTRAAVTGTARHVWYPVLGAGVVWRHWRDAHGASRYERMMRAAEGAGDREALLEWEARDTAEKQRRHDRVMDWVRSPLELIKAVAVGIGAVVALLLGLGVILAVANGDVSQVVAPIAGVVSAIAWTVWFLTAYGAFLLVAGSIGGLVLLWQIGRTQVAERTPGWMAAEAERAEEGGELVTADGIVTALMHLPIPKLRQAFKEAWQPRFELTPTREGQGAFRGFRTIFELPMGVPPKMLADAVEVFARNLHRIPVEVWVSDHGLESGGKAGFVNLYVADSGVMDKPTPAYPLLHDGQADVFAGVPIGITQRGEQVLMPVNGSNSVFGGQPGQGKSNAVRVAVAGIALDPLAEIRVHVFALNGDFDAYAPRLSRYEKGANGEHAESAIAHLEDLHAEVERREGRLSQVGAKKVTRSIAERYADLRPLTVVFSECHELFGYGDNKMRKLVKELAVAVVKRGRKTAITLMFDTQSARDGAIPAELVENVGFNGCFSVKTWRSNDGFLGDGSFAAGIRATELRFNVDRGTMVTTGATDEAFEIVRTYFIEVDDDSGWDQATEIIDRATGDLAAGTPAADTAPAPVVIPEVRDLLADLVEVLDGERVPAADVPARLRRLAPNWEPYRNLTGVKLRELLATDHQVQVPSTKNRWPVDPDTLRDAQARAARAADPADPDGSDPGTDHG